VFPPRPARPLVTIPYLPFERRDDRRDRAAAARRIEKRIRENHKVPFTYDDDVVSS
jgi:type VI secretion system protein VasG